MRRKKRKKNQVKEEKFSWRVINGFSWGKKIIGVGEEVLRLITASKKEDLFKQGKLAKVYPDGKIVKYKPPFTAKQDDINIFLNNPQSIFPYLERYDFDKKSLGEIIRQGKKYGMDESYLKVLRQAMEGKDG
jgi:hypothetical protein